MKKIIYFFTFTSICISSAWAQKSIVVTNPLALKRTELISIPYSKFTKHFTVDSVFTIKDKFSGKVYTHQLEKLGQPTIQNVLVEVEIDPKGKSELVVTTQTPSKFISKTYARYIPERFDDFAWENNVVAFRMYGKALEGKADDAQGMDYWSKRTENLIINKWYKTEDYHKDHGEGLDYYSVGQTLGAGDVGLYIDNKVHFTKHYRAYKILDNGPLRTTFDLIYDEENIKDYKIAFTKRISIDAAQHFNKIVLTNNVDYNITPIVFGLAKRKESNPEFYFDKKNKYLAYWEPEINSFGRTGTAIILPDQTNTELIESDSKQFLVKGTLKNKLQTIYYNGAAWNKAGQIVAGKDWQKHVEEYQNRLKKPLNVKLK